MIPNYNHNYICTYKSETKTDYQEDFLNIFKLKEYDEEIISQTVKNLWNYIYETTQDEIFRNVIKELCVDENGFVYLFSYDYLDISHLCFQNLLIYGYVKEENINKLKALIK